MLRVRFFMFTKAAYLHPDTGYVVFSKITIPRQFFDDSGRPQKYRLLSFPTASVQ